MALTATASQGFEYLRATSHEEILWLPADPGVTFTRGDLVTMTNGVCVLAGDSSANTYGTVEKTVISPAAATPWPMPDGGLIDDDTAAAKGLVKVRMHVAAGLPIYKVTFAGHFDDTLAAYTAATPSVTLTVSPGANDDTNSSLIYVYEGPGKGECNIGDDYDHASKVLTTHRKFNATLTTSSKVIIIEGEGGGVGGIGMLGRIDGADQNNLDATDGYNDGDWTVWCSWHQIGSFMQNLTLPVIRTNAVLNA